MRRFLVAVSKRKLFSTTANSHSDGLFLFDSATAMKLISTSTSSSLFDTFITDKYSIHDAPNGGYLMACALTAARQCITQQDPLTVTAHFFQKSIENAPAQIEVRILNETKSVSSVEMLLIQESKLKCKFTAFFGTLGNMKGKTVVENTCPDLPSPNECIDAAVLLRKFSSGTSIGAPRLRIAQTYKMLVPKDSAFAQSTLVGKVGTKSIVEAWVGFNDNRKVSLRSLALFCDAFPPPVLNVAPSDWVPTMEYTVHFWGRPQASDEYIRARFITPHVEQGMLHTDGDLWSQDGKKLLAKSRQLARIFSFK